MVKSKFLAVLLMLGLANLSLYIPAGKISDSCSCSQHEACQMDHDCPHCNAKKKPQKSSEHMCHSESSSATGKHKSHHANHKSHTSDHRDTMQAAKIFNPKCNSRTYTAFTLQARDPFIVNNYFTFEHHLPTSSLNTINSIVPEQIYLEPPEIPPRFTTFLS